MAASQDYAYCLEVFKGMTRRKSRWVLYKMVDFVVEVRCSRNPV
jgi:hypothetical protein